MSLSRPYRYLLLPHQQEKGNTRHTGGSESFPKFVYREKWIITRTELSHTHYHLDSTMQFAVGATVSINFALISWLLSPALAAASWTCSLASRPLENVPISPEQQQEILRQQQQQKLDGSRNLLRFPWIMDAIVIPVEPAEEDNQYRRQTTTTTEGDENSTTISLFNQPPAVTTTANTTTTNSTTTATVTSGTTVYHEGRHCGCANNFLFNNGVTDPDVEFYCPTPANQCSVWVTRNGDDSDYGVQCFKNMSWAVTTARQLWYYIVFWFVLLALYPIFTRPGHVSDFWL